MKHSSKALLAVGIVALVAVVLVSALRGQAQVAIAQAFLDAVARGDKAGAEALSAGSARESLGPCFSGTCDASPSGRAIALVRSGLTSRTSPNVSSSWNARCVEARVQTRAGAAVSLYVRVELRGETWLVTGASQERDDLLPACSDG